MKTRNYIFIGTLLLACVSQELFAQSDIVGSPGGHIRANGYYVGWNNTGTARSSTCSIGHVEEQIKADLQSAIFPLNLLNGICLYS